MARYVHAFGTYFLDGLRHVGHSLRKCTAKHHTFALHTAAGGLRFCEVRSGSDPKCSCQPAPRQVVAEQGALAGWAKRHMRPGFNDLHPADVSHMGAQGNLKYGAFRGVRDNCQLSVVPLDN
jgi:hypothetical protein